MTKNREKPHKKDDSFAAVAKRLECDPDLVTFDVKLKKIARPAAKPGAVSRRKQVV